MEIDQPYFNKERTINMGRRILNIILFSSCLLSYSQNPNFVWAKQISGNGCNNIGYSLKTDVSGNVYTIGTFDTITDFDPGPGTYTLSSFGYSDVFISKVDAAGNFVWAGKMGGNFVEYGTSIFIDNSSNVYSTGHFYSGVGDFDPGPGTYTLGMSGFGSGFVSKLNASGSFIWAKQIDGGYLNCNSIVVDVFGSVIICGTFRDTVDFDPGPTTYTMASLGFPTNAFITKLDANGNFIWAKQIKDSSMSQMRSIVCDGLGNIYCTGTFEGTADFDPGIGTYSLTVGTYIDLFVLKLDMNGNFIWAKQIGGGLGIVDPSTIKLDASNNIINAGSFNTTADFDPGPSVFNLIGDPYFDAYVFKLNVNGNFIWAKQFEGNGTESGKGMDVDINNDIYITGSFSDTTDFDPGIGTFTLSTIPDFKQDIYISKISNAGNFVWVKQLGDTSWDEGYAISVDANFNIYTTGYFRLTTDFDPNPGTYTLMGLGGRDAFVHKMCQLSCITGVEDVIENDSFILQPNPNNGIFTLEIISKEFVIENTELKIINVLGQEIKEFKIQSSKQQMNLAEVEAGIYYLQLQKNSKPVVTKKIIKQ